MAGEPVDGETLKGRLSVRKRASHFDFLSEKEVADFEAVFAEAFELPPDKEA
jgi:hypothetical protein